MLNQKQVFQSLNKKFLQFSTFSKFCFTKLTSYRQELKKKRLSPILYYI